MTYHVEFADADINHEVAQRGISEAEREDIAQAVEAQNAVVDDAWAEDPGFAPVLFSHVRLVADDETGTVIAGPVEAVALP